MEGHDESLMEVRLLQVLQAALKIADLNMGTNRKVNTITIMEMAAMIVNISPVKIKVIVMMSVNRAIIVIRSVTMNRVSA